MLTKSVGIYTFKRFRCIHTKVEEMLIIIASRVGPEIFYALDKTIKLCHFNYSNIFFLHYLLQKIHFKSKFSTNIFSIELIKTS